MRITFSIACGLAILLCGCGPAYHFKPSESAREAPAPAAYEASSEAKAPAESDAGLPAYAVAVPAKALPQDVLQRKIVYTAEVNLVVEDFNPVPGKINELLKQFGAVVAHSNIAGSPGRPRTGEWTIRVPVDRYNDFLAAARQLGELLTVKSDSRDVTEEYFDVDARIRNKKQEEQRLLKLLDSAVGKLKDILEIERELSRVREEVERMEGRMRVLNDITSLATVKLHIEEVKNYVPQKAATFATQARRVFDGSLGTLIATGKTLSLALIAFAPWAAVLIVVGAPLVALRFLLRRKTPNNLPGQ